MYIIIAHSQEEQIIIIMINVFKAGYPEKKTLYLLLVLYTFY